MILLVAQALEGVAEDADEIGDAQSARNAMYLARSIQGCATGASVEAVRAVEILLEQGISYVASVSERLEEVQLRAEVVERRSAIIDDTVAAARILH